MNGPHHNGSIRSQAGIHQRYDSPTLLLKQLYHGLGVKEDDLECKNIVFSEKFFFFGSLIYIFTMLCIFIVLYFWGAVFFVRERPSSSQSRSREELLR